MGAMAVATRRRKEHVGPPPAPPPPETLALIAACCEYSPVFPVEICRQGSTTSAAQRRAQAALWRIG